MSGSYPSMHPGVASSAELTSWSATQEAQATIDILPFSLTRDGFTKSVSVCLSSNRQEPGRSAQRIELTIDANRICVQGHYSGQHNVGCRPR